MTDQELIESLRLWNRNDAADRIEELVKERDDAREYAAKIRIRERAAEDAVISATDKLAKAVEALRYYADASPVARAVLAELEGK